ECAGGLDWVAEWIDQVYHVRVGFTIDPFNAYQGDDVPRFNCDVGYCPSPYNSCLGESQSLLGIQGFNSEIVRPGDIALNSPPPWIPENPGAGEWGGAAPAPPRYPDAREAPVARWKRP